jgi:hypothetical protein
MNRKPWSKPIGALAGFVFVALFVTVPEIHQTGWRPSLLTIGAIAGAVGAVAGWLLVVIRNRLMS